MDGDSAIRHGHMYGSKGRCRLCERIILGWWWKGRCLSAGQGRPGRAFRLSSSES